MDQENKIPKYLTEIISSPEIFSALEKIEGILGLNIDQSGELYVLISEIIIGKQKSADFISQVKKRLGVNTDRANKIAEETNKKIFEVVKAKLQNQTEISTLEQVGGFNIEKEKVAAEVQVNPSDRARILNGLENPPQSVLTSKGTENHTEPLVDYLLKNPIGQVEQKQHVTPKAPDNLPVAENTPTVIETKIPINKPQDIPKETPKPPQRQGPDPYREVLK